MPANAMKNVALALAGLALSVLNVFYVLGVFFSDPTHKAYGELWLLTAAVFVAAMALCFAFPRFRFFTSGFAGGVAAAYPAVFLGVLGITVGWDIALAQVVLMSIVSVFGFWMSPRTQLRSEDQVQGE